MKYILLFITVFILTGCKEKINVVTETEDITINKEIEVYSDIYLNDIITINDVELLSDNYKIDTEELGIKTYEILYKKDKKKYSYTFDVEIKDTTKPKLLSGTSRTVVKGYNKDICDLITYGDNYTGNLKCEIIGNYDVNKIGTYSITYSISDSSNNTINVDGVLNVVNEINNTYTPDNYTTPISEVYELYKKNNEIIGIDVSEWQGIIDYNKVKNAGVEFVIIRIGVQTTDGEPKIDGRYYENIKNAKEAGLKVGVYLYTIAGTREEAKEQALWVINKLNGETLDLGITFDWENFKYWNSYKISFHEINEIANTFMNTAKEKGYNAMLYSSKFYLENIWENKLNYPVWLAHYIAYKTDYKGDYKIWQLCSNGLVDGINGFVDFNLMYGKFE